MPDGEVARACSTFVICRSTDAAAQLFERLTLSTMAWNQFVGITALLYALTNPVGAIPIFLAMTRNAESVKRHRIITLASAAVADFFVGSALLGKQILNFFNVGLDDFRIAGGLLALNDRVRNVSGAVWKIHISR